MDLLDRLIEDHEHLRRALDHLAGEICQDRDGKGLPAGWKVRSEAELVRALRMLLPALLAHEEIEEKLLYRPLAEAGQEEAVFRILGADHKALETMVQSLTSILTGERDKPYAWLVATTLRLNEMLSEHMRREEYDVFPMVRTTLTRRQLQELGRRAEAILHPAGP
jgi:hemerythrin-like domain-containing protein